MNLHGTAVEHMGCNTPAAAAVMVVEAETGDSDHNQVVSMHHTVAAAAAVAETAACRGWRGVAHTAAGLLGVAGGSIGVLEVGSGGGWGPEDCTHLAAEPLGRRPVPTQILRSCHLPHA